MIFYRNLQRVVRWVTGLMLAVYLAELRKKCVWKHEDATSIGRNVRASSTVFLLDKSSQVAWNGYSNDL